MDQDRQPGSLELPASLISPEHASRMGGALWVFLFLWREADAGGEVRGGRPIQVQEIAWALSMPERTVKRHLATLRKADYLETWKEPSGFTAWVQLWEPEDEIGQDDPRGAKNGPMVEQDEHGAKNGPTVGPKMAPRSDREAKFGPSATPPGPPLNGTYKDSSLRLSSSSSQPCHEVLKDPTATNVVPFMRGRAGGEKPAAAGAAGDPPEPPRRRHGSLALMEAELQLERIEAWERPELTATLAEKMSKLSPDQVDQVFENCWRAHRTRRKDLDNPAGWWASMLARWADTCAQIMGKGATKRNTDT